MKDNKQKGLASLFITFVILVFLGFLAYNVLSGGKNTEIAANSSETAITSADSAASSESGESSSVDESSDVSKEAIAESTISGETTEDTGKTSKSGTGKIKLGLDLAGGVSITYQTVEPNPSDEDMADTIYKL